MIRSATYPSLEDRVVFVTGGGSGIGASIVEHFCAQRARVAFVDIQREASAALVETLRARGLPAPVFIPCDLRDVAALRAAVAEAQTRLGAIRVLVNNAAHDERHAIEAVTPEDWDDCFAVDLPHQFFSAQALVPGMAEAGGGLGNKLPPASREVWARSEPRQSGDLYRAAYQTLISYPGSPWNRNPWGLKLPD